MVKRGRSGGVSNRRFQNLVLQSSEKGSTAEEIVNELRSKDREWARLSRHVLLLNVNQTLQSRNVSDKDEEESNARSKSRKRAATASPSGSSWSDAVGTEILHWLVHAIANETGVPFHMISASEVVSGVSGESEENIRKLFSKAYRTAPSIIFIDEIEAIASKRDNHQQKGMETRIVTQLMNCMDQESLRFDKDFCLGMPDEKAREEILTLILRNRPLDPSFDIARIVRKTSGFVGADLALLVKEAANVAMERLVKSRGSELGTDIDSLLSMQPCPFPPQVIEKLFYTISDFEEALKKFKPSLTREGFSTTPSVTWEDIGGLDHIRKEFYSDIIKPLKYPEECEGFKFCSGRDFLLYGPPGCGTGALSKYVGDSEKAIRELFNLARMCSPCIIFFDEVDALTTKRGSGEGAWVVERPLTQLLNEMSGGKERDGVFVIGATNRPEMMDPAITRPGRFGKHIYIPLPNSVQRGLILKSLARKIPLDTSVDLDAIARRCENFSGADLEALVIEAGLAARDDETGSYPRRTKMVHFEEASSRMQSGR
ncbi:AAA+ ATPase domain [Arabidopsis thaliana x Arabidopsis arenosa]|uniref:AAA+ ATPase domain n=1 Tax=Arabidopsis thaliana x Arabidopsis arenosa TaxID=1240361 RepID=A0A8T2GE32_9BRAS|nr:AAA+ ATPase domain [Arabidopsis thaliana x Arabidopsis arenosa]